MIDPRRIHSLNSKSIGDGPVVYWMSRDQRAADNWALLFAREMANDRPLLVVFALSSDFLEATWRQYAFLLAGLKTAQTALAAKNIPFYLMPGHPPDVIARFVETHRAGCLVTDFDPLKIKQEWIKTLNQDMQCPFYEVDAHNIVPCRIATGKQEFAARTLRPKLHRLLPEFLTPFPGLKTMPPPSRPMPAIHWEGLQDGLAINMNVQPVAGIAPGPDAAKKQLRAFVDKRLAVYPTQSNDPNSGATSGLSPYLHFGHIAAQRVALSVSASGAPGDAIEAFLEELIVRRELADNFCFYNPDYDNPEGFAGWAKQTLGDHQKDKRSYLYTTAELESAATHDSLWNAAQLEMVHLGTMHGYLRMYWAKKILEWTHDPERAQADAIYLNNTYQLDGRDPNGYTGIAWSIGGVHDRAWPERPVFGKVRYMNQNGCRRKFDVDAYINRISTITGTPS